MFRPPPVAAVFQAALNAALLAARCVDNLIMVAIEGSPIRGSVRQVLDQFRDPSFPPATPDEIDRDYLITMLEQLNTVLEEHSGRVDVVADWLLRVATVPHRLGNFTRATAHELAWDFACKLRSDIKKLLTGRGEWDPSPNFNPDQCRRHWRNIRAYLRILRGLDVLGVAEAARIEFVRAEERFLSGESEYTATTATISVVPQARGETREGDSGMSDVAGGMPLPTMGGAGVRWPRTRACQRKRPHHRL